MKDAVCGPFLWLPAIAAVYVNKPADLMSNSSDHMLQVVFLGKQMMGTECQADRSWDSVLELSP